MKKALITICILSSFLSCKKKSSDNPEPVIPVVNNDGSSANCIAKNIIETKGPSVTNVAITYAGGIPATIKVDSNGTRKVDLTLDGKGSILSGTVPVPFNGSTVLVDFTSTNTYGSDGLLIKSVFVSTNLAPATGTITSFYTYDAGLNLKTLVRTTYIEFFGLVQQSLKDSIAFEGYTNGRPTKSLKYTQDVKAGTPMSKIYEEGFEYDSKMNRTKITRNSVVTDEITFSSETYPAKVAYLLDLEGNPNYGNKDQNLNFVQYNKTYTKCSSSTVASRSDVKTFQKSGGCVTKVILADTVSSCTASPTMGSSSYDITY